MPRRLTPEKYHSLACEKGYTWLGPVVSNNKTKTWWMCPEGHRWHAPYHSLRSGHGCTYCLGLDRKLPAHYEALAIKRGFMWLGPEVANVMSKTGWRCSKGHDWQATYNVIHQGHGCPECAQIPRLQGIAVAYTDVEYNALARKIGYVWLGPLPERTHHKTWWMCSAGHKRQTTYTILRDGFGCPTCAGRLYVNGKRVSKIQLRMHEMIGGEVNYKLNGCWVDVGFPDDKVAVEFDCWYWHKDKQEKDARRNQRIRNAGWSLVCVLAERELPKQECLDLALDLARVGLDVEIRMPGWKGE